MSYTEPHPLSSALVTIDMQADFVRSGAPLEIPGARDIVPPIRRLLRRYREAGRFIIHMVRLYEAGGSNVDLCRRGRVENGKPILRPGTPGAEIVEALRPAPSARLDAEQLLAGDVQEWGDHEAVIYKPRWGAFYRTALETYLRPRGLDTLVFCGCHFPNCVRASVYEASERDFRIVVVKDAISGIYDRAEEELFQIGVRLWETTQVIEWLTKPAAANSGSNAR